MTSIIKVNNIQNSSGTAAMTIDGSSNVTFPQNATFTGTVTGSGMDKLASASATSVNTVDISLDYSGYVNFRLILNATGTASTSGNLAFRWKRDGQSAFDTSDIYGSQGVLFDTANNHLNNNGTATYAYIVFTQNPNRGFQSDLFLGGFGSSTIPTAYHGLTTMTGMTGAVSTFGIGGSYDNATNAREKIKEIQIFFNTGDISEIYYSLYGLKE